MGTQVEESPVLVLPSDGERVQKLRRKHAEYTERIASYDRAHSNQHPDFRARQMAVNICKVAILDALFRDRRISAWDVSKQFVEERQAKDAGSGPTFANAWVEAWGVIQDYCETGGANVGDGTRLR